MIAYKVWNDTRHFIHKDTTDELNVIWTTNINDALNTDNLYKESGLPSFAKAYEFFFDTLGFNINSSRYNALQLM